MKDEANISNEYKDQIEKLLEDFISIIYKGHDHIIARKYYRELFYQLLPKYFCLCDDKEKFVHK